MAIASYLSSNYGNGPTSAAPTAPAAPTLPPGYITAGSSPVFSPGPSIDSVDIGSLFKNAGGGGAGANTVTSNIHGSTPTPTFTPPAFPSAGGAGASTPTFAPPPTLPQFGFSNDPNVADSLALEQQGLGQLDAALKSAREKAIIGFGDPALASEAGLGEDSQAGAFARQNYLSGNSTMSRLDKQHSLARQAVINQLASHGILQSGDLGYQEGQADQNYGNQVYDAKNSILDYLSNLLNSYNQNRTTLHQATIAARQNALNAFAANPDAYAQYFGG